MFQISIISDFKGSLLLIALMVCNFGGVRRDMDMITTTFGYSAASFSTFNVPAAAATGVNSYVISMNALTLQLALASSKSTPCGNRTTYRSRI